jgi:hypothetical protein
MLIFCPACNEKVSANAAACPKCGNPVDAHARDQGTQSVLRKNNIKGTIFAVVVLIALFGAIWWGVTSWLDAGKPSALSVEAGSNILACADRFLNGDIDAEEASDIIRGYLDALGAFRESDNQYEADIWETSRQVFGDLRTFDTVDAQTARRRVENSRYELSMALRRANIKGTN